MCHGVARVWVCVSAKVLVMGNQVGRAKGGSGLKVCNVYVCG